MTKKERPSSNPVFPRLTLASFLFFFAPFCFGGTEKIGLETEFGRGYLGSELSFTHLSDHTSSNAWQFSSWSAWLSANQSKYRTGSDNEFQVQRGLDVSTSVAFDYRDFFNLDTYLFHSKTRETQYGQVGIELRGTFYFGEKDSSESIPDRRSYAGLGFGTSQINQDFDADVLAAGLDPHLRMQSEMIEVTVGGSPSDSWSLEGIFDRQQFSKSKEDLENLEPNPSAQFNSIDLTSSISELTTGSASLQILIHPMEEWELALKGKESTLVIDNSKARELRLTGSYFFDNSQASLGLVQWSSFDEIEYTVVTHFILAL